MPNNYIFFNQKISFHCYFLEFLKNCYYLYYHYLIIVLIMFTTQIHDLSCFIKYLKYLQSGPYLYNKYLNLIKFYDFGYFGFLINI